MDKIALMKEKMLGVSARHGLPTYFKTDIDVDFEVMDEHPGKPFIWLLRSHGTQILPIGIGAPDAFITYWVEQESVVVFLVHPVDGTISKITNEKALSLAQRPPAKIEPHSAPTKVVEQVTSVLGYGLDKHVWGMFDNPQMQSSPDFWRQWSRYFWTCGNQVMALFMEQAIKELNRQQQLAA